MEKSTWREQTVTLQAGIVTPVTFRDTRPNAFVIQNRSNERVYVALTPNVSAGNYLLVVAAYAVRKLVRPDPVDMLYLYAAGNAMVFVGSLEVKFDISLVGETQEIAEPVGGLGTVNVQTIIDPLPAGTNKIGKVDVDTLPEVTPTGWTWAKVEAAAAGDVVVKNAPGKVAMLVNDSAATIMLKDGVNQAWKAGDFISYGCPLQCTTSIVVNFSAAGTAWILYQ